MKEIITGNENKGKKKEEKNMKRILGRIVKILSVFGIVVTTAGVTAPALINTVPAENVYAAGNVQKNAKTTAKKGWVRENGGMKYYKDGKAYTGWHYMTKAEGEKTPHWSYFGNDGIIRTGWQQMGKGTGNPDGNAAKHWSYFGTNGWLRTGWQQMGKGTGNPDGNSSKHWSYFGGNGWLRTGWVQLGKGTSEPDGNSAKHWSYFGSNGWLRTGMQDMGKGTKNPDGNAAKHKSYFGDNGWLVTNRLLSFAGTTYLADSRGWLMTVAVKNTQNTTQNTTAKRPLKSISLNETSIELQYSKPMGKMSEIKQTGYLYVNYSPSDTTDLKDIKWTSSDNKIATVESAGADSARITPHKEGTVKITANVNGKKASCTVKVYDPLKIESYWDVSEAYELLNEFRTTKSNQWYWNPDNKTKTYTYGLKALTRDAELEETAKLRAKEQWTQYYVNGKVTHDRPNGQDCFSAYPSSVSPTGENLAWLYGSSKSVVLDGWAENDEKYGGQGHRINMLSGYSTKVGIACFEKGGATCWVMCLGR